MDVIGNCRRYEQEQRVYELQRELEFSNATLRKMTVTWEIYEEPPAKTKKLEEVHINPDLCVQPHNPKIRENLYLV